MGLSSASPCSASSPSLPSSATSVTTLLPRTRTSTPRLPASPLSLGSSTLSFGFLPKAPTASAPLPKPTATPSLTSLPSLCSATSLPATLTSSTLAKLWPPAALPCSKQNHSRFYALLIQQGEAEPRRSGPYAENST